MSDNLSVTLMTDGDVSDLIERVLVLARQSAQTEQELDDCDKLEDWSVNYLGDD